VVLPFFSCSARLPVYVLLVSFLFSDRAGAAAAAFAGCYALGAIAALGSSVVLRRSVLRGPASVLAIDLPGWRVPRVLAAARVAGLRSGAFLRKAGTVILVMMMGLWWLSTYPQVEPSAAVVAMREAAAREPDGEAAAVMMADAAREAGREAARSSFMGRFGRALSPVFEPLGYDWQITIGVVSSFAAREVFVSTMSVVLAGEEEGEGIMERIRGARRDDGSLVFDRPTLWSLLVFYVLAMQCLPTLAVTAREAGGVRWAVLQLVWMTGAAYFGALAARLIAIAVGG
jgi:ferrous iron transport protein B